MCVRVRETERERENVCVCLSLFLSFTLSHVFVCVRACLCVCMRLCVCFCVCRPLSLSHFLLVLAVYFSMSLSSGPSYGVSSGTSLHYWRGNVSRRPSRRVRRTQPLKTRTCWNAMPPAAKRSRRGNWTKRQKTRSTSALAPLRVHLPGSATTSRCARRNI